MSDIDFMPFEVEVEWVSPQTPAFLEDSNEWTHDDAGMLDTLNIEPCACRPVRSSELKEAQAAGTSQSDIFQQSSLALIVDTCENVDQILKPISQRDELPKHEILKTKRLELEVTDDLTSIDHSFQMLSTVQDLSINAARALKYAKSSIRMVSAELWSQIFLLAIAPFGLVGRDEKSRPDTDYASLSGAVYCCPDTLMLVCTQWKDVALRTSALWVNLSKAHIFIPSPISFALTSTDAIVKELARTQDPKWLLARILRNSLAKDCLETKALTYAVRSRESPLYVDLRYTTQPSAVLETLRPHFSRVRVLYINTWDTKTVKYLDSLDLLDGGRPQPNASYLFPNLKTISFTATSCNSLVGGHSQGIFPHIFNEAPSLRHLRIGFQFDLLSHTFANVFWSYLEVLELDQILDATDILCILKECGNLKDLILTCPSIEGGDPISVFQLGSTQAVRLSHLRSLHYRCDTDYDDDLTLLELLELPKLEVLSLLADVDPDPGMYLESTAAQYRLMKKMFCGDWPKFSTLELLHYDASNLAEVQAIKAAMDEFIASNCPRGAATRKISICGRGITEEHGDRFHLCSTEGVGGTERLQLAIERINDCV